MLRDTEAQQGNRVCLIFTQIYMQHAAAKLSSLPAVPLVSSSLLESCADFQSLSTSKSNSSFSSSRPCAVLSEPIALIFSAILYCANSACLRTPRALFLSQPMTLHFPRILPLPWRAFPVHHTTSATSYRPSSEAHLLQFSLPLLMPLHCSSALDRIFSFLLLP